MPEINYERLAACPHRWLQPAAASQDFADSWWCSDQRSRSRPTHPGTCPPGLGSGCERSGYSDNTNLKNTDRAGSTAPVFAHSPILNCSCHQFS